MTWILLLEWFLLYVYEERKDSTKVIFWQLIRQNYAEILKKMGRFFQKENLLHPFLLEFKFLHTIDENRKVHEIIIFFSNIAASSLHHPSPFQFPINHYQFKTKGSKIPKQNPKTRL